MADDTRDPLDDDSLRAAFRSGNGARGRSHLSDAEWERLTCDEMPPGERDTALVHIMSCAECTAIHRSLMQLRAGAMQIAPPSLRSGEAGSRSSAGTHCRRWSIYGGLAAAAAIVIALLINRPARVDPGSVLRSGAAAAVVTVLSPHANEPAVDRRFSWQGIAGATAYELRVTTQDGARIFTSRRDETFAELPAEIDLQEGTYYWRVLAFKGDAEIAASPLIPFISRGR